MNQELRTEIEQEANIIARREYPLGGYHRRRLMMQIVAAVERILAMADAPEVKS